MNKVFATLFVLTIIFSTLALANEVSGSQLIYHSPAPLNETNISVAETGNMHLVGNDVDEHGCKPSAGYSWCPVLNQCARIWEHPECNLVAKPTTASSCVDDVLKSELNYLFAKLKEAEQNNDTETYMGLKGKIETVTNEMAARNSACQVAMQVNSTSYGSSSATPLVNKISVCNDMETLKIKIAHYENLLNNNASLSASSMSAEDIKSNLIELRAMLSEKYDSCNNLTKNNLGILVSQAVKNKEGGANDISAYYKMKLSDIISSNQSISDQIASLKQLRDEIDSLVESLIEKQDNISSDDLSQVVSEIKIMPGSIIADNLSVNATNKTLNMRMGNKFAEIRNNGKYVEFGSENITANASEIIIENGTAKIGNITIKIMPSEAVSLTGLNPKNMELIESNGIIYYKIIADEDRKFMGLFMIKVEKHVDINGVNGSIESESMPFWAFLTTA